MPDLDESKMFCCDGNKETQSTTLNTTYNTT